MLYEASVPVFSRYLERLAGLVDEAGSLAARTGLSEEQVLQMRMAADMLPFASQVVMASNFSLRACFPLAGRAVPPFAGATGSLPGLRAEVLRARDLVGQLEPGDFAGAASRILRDTVGEATLELPATAFLLQFALPNFFFHLTAAYAILRSRGARIGKAHFDGYHVY